MYKNRQKQFKEESSEVRLTFYKGGNGDMGTGQVNGTKQEHPKPDLSMCRNLANNDIISDELWSDFDQVFLASVSSSVK